MRKINQIVLHHSATRWGTAEKIRKWHLKRGWNDIGYHFVILNGKAGRFSTFNPREDGEVVAARPLAIQGAHVKGHNENTIGICLIGNSHFTAKQMYATKLMIEKLRGQLGPLDVVTHNELAKTECPGFTSALFCDMVGIDKSVPTHTVVRVETVH